MLPSVINTLTQIYIDVKKKKKKSYRIELFQYMNKY